jgi:hypothetical protein
MKKCMERAKTGAVGREINGKAGVEWVAEGRDMEQDNKGWALKLFVAAGGEDFELGLNADAEGLLEEQTLKRKARAINVKGQESASTSRDRNQLQRQGTGISFNISPVLFR